MPNITSKSIVVIGALMLGASTAAFAYDSGPVGQASGSVPGATAPANDTQHGDDNQTGERASSAQNGVTQKRAMSSHRWVVTPSDPFRDHGT